MFFNFYLFSLTIILEGRQIKVEFKIEVEQLVWEMFSMI